MYKKYFKHKPVFNYSPIISSEYPIFSNFLGSRKPIRTLYNLDLEKLTTSESIRKHSGKFFKLFLIFHTIWLHRRRQKKSYFNSGNGKIFTLSYNPVITIFGKVW